MMKNTKKVSNFVQSPIMNSIRGKIGTIAFLYIYFMYIVNTKINVEIVSLLVVYVLFFFLTSALVAHKYEWRLVHIVLITWLISALLIVEFNPDTTNYGFLIFIPILSYMIRSMRVYQKYRDLIITLLFFVLFTGAVGWFQHRDFTGLLGPTFSIGAIIFTLQSRRESRKLDAIRLVELQEAHSELQKTHEQLQETTVLALQATANAERVKIAREIHDGVGHELTSLIVSLQAIDLMLPKDVMEAKKRLPEVIATARNAVREVRQAVRDWTDEDAEQQFAITGIEGLLRQYAYRANLILHFTNQTPTYVWQVPQCLLTYRILQEAMTNIVRHAKATTVWIAMEFEESTLMITISDNGGFQGERLTFGFGLSQMKKRIEEVKGSLCYRQRNEHGLTLECKIPIDEGVMKK